jgi:hypothetical protein
MALQAFWCFLSWDKCMCKARRIKKEKDSEILYPPGLAFAAELRLDILLMMMTSIDIVNKIMHSSFLVGVTILKHRTTSSLSHIHIVPN